ncbi:MAG: alpha/beta fold hydrolase, partial [Candidatus Methanomethylophilaceae archaeon]|nr:alpha/beta fold hydrolase [Candidatus Methanomethylophilaceae archaeon]
MNETDGTDVPFAETDGARVHYETYGRGIPVILVTGLNGTVSFWDRLVQLMGDGYRTVAIDNRGAGLTEYRGPFSMSDMADDVRCIMDAEGIASAHLVGWSMGSHISLNLAARHPGRVRSLTLVSSMTRTPSRSSYILTSMAKKL